MYVTESAGETLYVAGWEGLYRRTSGTAWVELCAATLHIAGEQWTDLAVVSDSLVFVSSQDGWLYACDPTTGATTQVAVSAPVRRMGIYNGDLTATGNIGFAGLPTSFDYIARYVNLLPETNTEGGRGSSTIAVLAALAAITALAGTQLLRRRA